MCNGSSVAILSGCRIEYLPRSAFAFADVSEDIGAALEEHVIFLLRMNTDIRNKNMGRKNWQREGLLDRANRALWRLRDSNTHQADRVHTVFGLYTRMMHDWRYSTDSASQVLNHHLSRYRWENLLTLDMKPYSRAATDVMGEDFDEYCAIRAFLDLAATEDGLSRIKLCPDCGEWFIAVRRGDQRFCGGACRQKLLLQPDET